MKTSPGWLFFRTDIALAWSAVDEEPLKAFVDSSILYSAARSSDPLRSALSGVVASVKLSTATTTRFPAPQVKQDHGGPCRSISFSVLSLLELALLLHQHQ
jgi:hypothetical protein